jgi:hypothetical protein
MTSVCTLISVAASHKGLSYKMNITIAFLMVIFKKYTCSLDFLVLLTMFLLYNLDMNLRGFFFFQKKIVITHQNYL